MTTVLIVNDQALQRLGLRMFLEAQSDLTIAGEATACAEAVRLADTLRPDVVLMDMGRPDEKHIQAIHRITRPAEDSTAPHADGTDTLPRGYCYSAPPTPTNPPAPRCAPVPTESSSRTPSLTN